MSNIFIVEDNAIQAAAMVEELEENGYTVVGVAKNASVALSEIKHHSIDVLILDIQLDGSSMDGIGIAKSDEIDPETPIVFVSAFKDKPTLERLYATKPAAFLSKPYKYLDLISAIEIALGKKDGKEKKDFGLSQIMLTEYGMFIKNRKGFQKINKEELLYLEAKRSYTDVHTSKGLFEISLPMGQLVEKLSAFNLIRIHRSYAVNLEAMTSFNDHSIQLGDLDIPVSGSYKSEFRKMLSKM